MAYLNNAVYWLGSDGNIWYKGSDGQVVNKGKPINYNQGATNWDNGADTMSGSFEATRIADPNPPKTTATAAPASTGGSNYADKSADIAVQQAGLQAADQQQEAGLSAVDKALENLIGKYTTEASANEENYGTQSTTNNQNLQKNRQTAYVNAAQGRQGLFGTLSSLGALSGSGIDLANRAVQNGANADLSGAQDTFGENQTGLDTAINTFRRQDKMRREDASTAADNARTNVRNQTAQNKQKFYANLADDFTAQGDTGNAKKYADMAAALFPTLAKTSIPDSNIAYTAAAFTPGTLSSYMAGQNSSNVSVTPSAGDGSHLPGLVASTKDKRKQAAGVA